MRAQLSMFLLVGVVLVITVGLLILLVRAAQPPTAQPDVNGNEALTTTCLSQITDRATDALRDDGVITTDEAGPLPEADHSYVTTEYPSVFLYGRNKYIGLCAREGPNAIGREETPFSCPQKTYARPGITSIQEQLQHAITLGMRNCTDTQHEAEVIMQRDNLVVRYNEHTHQKPIALTSTWAAINHVIKQETSNTSWEPPATVSGCPRCKAVEVTRTKNQTHDNYTFSVQGRTITNIQFQDRGLIMFNTTNEPITVQQIGITCTSSICQLPIYSVDGDDFTATPDGPAEIVRRLSDDQEVVEIQACDVENVTVTDERGSTIYLEGITSGECPT